MKTAELGRLAVSPAAQESYLSVASYLKGRRRWRVLAVAAAVAVVSMLIAATIGSVGIPVSAIMRILLARLPFLSIVPDWPAAYEAIVFQIRLPRVIMAALVGGALAISGATYQGIFRNPLADPYLIGVASGAAFGATLAFMLPVDVSFLGLGLVQIAAFLGALAVVAIVYSLARVGNSTPMTTLLLAGVAIGSLFWAATAFLMIAAGDKLRVIYIWLLGGFSLGYWSGIVAILPYLIVGLVVTLFYARPLNVMQLDEDQARQLGVNVERLKLILVAAASLMTAAAVSVSGIIGFVGLIVPHVVRMIWGPDHRFLLPMSALVGSVFLVWADTASRIILAPGELPVGILTALFGAPFFLYLLRQKKKAVF
ncbi:MAG: iron chelate uptake ABC transporter family permease subunit [Dehalococcoidia bacterium]|nr:iron chelate uptake ABC transporter family permease subunit [Dehalococcoidia bacterium]